MRDHNLPKITVSLLTANSERRFADRRALMAHLERLGVAAPEVNPDPVQISTEGALWGSIAAQGLVGGTVIVSDGAASSGSQPCAVQGFMRNG